MICWRGWHLEKPLVKLLTVFISILTAHVAGTGSNLISKWLMQFLLYPLVLTGFSWFSHAGPVVGDRLFWIIFGLFILVILVVVNVKFWNIFFNTSDPASSHKRRRGRCFGSTDWARRARLSDWAWAYGLVPTSHDKQNTVPHVHELFLVGGWPTPLKDMEVSWDDEIPNIWKVMKFHGSKPPTRFCWMEKQTDKSVSTVYKYYPLII